LDIVKTIKYFAYGSNMHRFRLWQRVPSSKTSEKAILRGYTLRFHKCGGDGSGKCNILYTGLSSDYVAGIVYEIDRQEKCFLDGAEGDGYESKEVHVDTPGIQVSSFTYVATADQIEDSLVPYDWYKELVVGGARSHELSAEYIAGLEAVECMRDPDHHRSSAHWEIAQQDILL